MTALSERGGALADGTTTEETVPTRGPGFEIGATLTLGRASHRGAGGVVDAALGDVDRALAAHAHHVIVETI